MAAMLVTAGVSCTKEETVEPQVQDGVRFVVNTAENTPVKSFIENNGDKTYTPKWSRGDKLAVFAGNAPELSGVLSNTNETGTIAKFEGSISGIATSGTFNSFAPASAYKSAAAGTAEIELASTQHPGKDTVDEACDVLVAKPCNYTVENEAVTVNGLTFKRVFSVLKINLKGETLSGEKVKSLKFTAPEGTVLAGCASVALDNARIGNWRSSTATVSAEYGDDAPVFGTDRNAVYLVVNPTTIPTGSELSFEVTTGNQTVSKTVTLEEEMTFPGSGMAVINLTLEKTFNIADLPNCYMVKPGESVTFPVLKAYEVWRKITFINGGNLRNDGELGAVLIWQDTQSLISEVALNADAVNPDQSTITVRTNAGNGGNALVSVTMGGDKVWSWHIWVTDFNPDGNASEIDNNGDGVTDYTFMDRNLGAMTPDVNDPLSVGMYYQGAKNTPYAGFTDKFPTDGTSITSVPLYDINNAEVKYTTGDVWNSNQGQATRRVLTDPCLFVTAGGEPYSWITTDSNAAFEYGPNFWSEEATGEKGVFDPCPDGWMVPVRKNNLSPWNSFGSGNSVLVDPTSVYPKSGRMKFNGTFGDTGLVMLFCGTMYGNKNYAFYGTSTDVNPDNNYSLANALNVRCVKVQ